MNLKLNDDGLVIISDDQMDVKYLEYLFANGVEIKFSSDLIRNGFHETTMRRVRVNITKDND